MITCVFISVITITMASAHLIKSIYLKRNNVKFRVEPFEYGDGRETLGITEYDRRNREYQFTGFELNCENRVMREIYERDGSRKRIGFDENATYITEFPQI